jgi:hypothetical protein
VTSSDHSSTPASAPRTGAAGGATLGCGDLAAAYARMCEAIHASAARGDADEENRLRNRAQVVLGRMLALRCPVPPTR